MTRWLAVEREENWNTDANHNYRSFGLPERKRKLAEQVKNGDQIIFYVSAPVSAITHIRLIEGDGVIDNEVEYDDLFPIMIKTRPLRVLTVRQWVPFSQIGIHKAVLQNAFRKLEEVEGQRLYQLVWHAQSANMEGE